MQKRNILKALSIGLGSVAVIGGVFFIVNRSDFDAKAYLKFLDLKSYNLSKLVEKIEWTNKTRNEYVFNQVVRDELEYQKVWAQALVPFQQMVLLGQRDKLSPFFKENKAIVKGVPTNLNAVFRNKDGIQEFKFGAQKNHFAEDQGLERYLAEFSKIEDFRIDVLGYFIDQVTRAEKDSSATGMTLTAQLDIRGLDKNGKRRNDQGPIRVQVDLVDSQWKISAISLGNIIAVVSDREPAFEEITQTAFEGGTPDIVLRREAIRRGGYALALADVNNDGNVDLYAGAGSNSMMWLGKGDGRFERVRGTEVEKDKLVKTAIFADFTNTGKKDLFITTFDQADYSEDLVLYSNDGKGNFSRVGDPTRGMGRLDSYYPMPAVTADFNGDGLLDIYVGFPGMKDFTFMTVDGNQVSGGKKSVQGMFWNKGDLKFTESILKIPSMKEGDRQYLFPHSALALDLFRRKKLDIVVLDDQDNLSPVYMNDGAGQFEQVAEKIGLADSENSMSAAAVDFNNDGLMDFAMTSANNFASERLQFSMANNWGVTHRMFNGKAIRLFEQTPNGKFKDVTEGAGLNFAGAGGAGVIFFDYNNDGLQDIYFKNGLWSGDDRYQEVDYVMQSGRLLQSIHADIIKDRHNSSQSEFMNFLVHFKGDLFEKNLRGDKTVSFAGYQRNRLFRNNGDGTFTDVGFLEGVDSIYDGYVAAKASLTKDGRADLILHNGDPGQDTYKFPPLQVFKNRHKNKNSLSVALEGRSVNRDAIGVGVTVQSGGMSQYQQLISNEGPSQSEHILQFGLADAKIVDKVIVHWPGGDQVLEKVAPGRIKIMEPDFGKGSVAHK